MKQITREERERIAKIISKLKYRLYQAEIGFLSHDYERLGEMTGKIGINVRKIKILLKEKTPVRKSRTGRITNFKRSK